MIIKKCKKLCCKNKCIKYRYITNGVKIFLALWNNKTIKNVAEVICVVSYHYYNITRTIIKPLYNVIDSLKYDFLVNFICPSAIS